MSDTTTTILDTSSARDTISFADLMPRIAQEYNKPLGAQLKDMLALSIRGNKLTTEEYYMMGLYDDTRYTLEEKRRFAGIQASRHIWNTLNRTNPWVGVMSNKLSFEHLMRGYGLRVPHTLALISEEHNAPNPPALASIEDFRTFLTKCDYPIFGKPLNAHQSIGVISLSSFDPGIDILTKHDGTQISLGDLWREISEQYCCGYMLQTCLTQHSQLTQLCGKGVATIRIITLDQGHGPELYRAVIKLTGKRNIADNFWRSGNLLAAIDLKNGIMGKALTQMGPDGTWLSTHQDSGQTIEGTALPLWDEVKQTALTAASILQKSLIIGFDIAITDTGPVIIEANHDPHLIMLQAASGQGVMDTPMHASLAYAKQCLKQDHENGRAILKTETKDNSVSASQVFSKKSA